jgi:hypothetical protein
LDTKKQVSNPVFIAAEEAQFLKDGGLRSKINDFNTKIVAAKYVESLMVGRVSVTVAEIDGYYNKNMGQFKRRGDEVMVLLFEGQDKSSAIKIKNVLDRNGLDSEKSSGVIKKHKPRRVFLKKTQLSENMSDRIFNSNPGSSFILEKDIGFVVFYIVGVFKKGTVKDLVYVNDEIQSKILAIKKYQLKEKIIDSLSVEYGKN